MILFGLVAVALALIGFELFGSDSTGGAKSDAPPRCGDGRLNQRSEQCDDGNENNADACNNKCQRTKDLCGNGKIEGPLEECDDGNKENDDGCDQFCKREEKYGRCGNGKVEPGEACDDGNSNELDGCNTLCQKTVIAGGAKPELCGNGQIDEGEGCDDGNTVNGDGCSRDCQVTKQGPWFTPECNKCMVEHCEADSEKCLGDSDCVDSLKCIVENACMSPTVGPMACYCGAQGVSQCAKPDTEPQGPCVKETEQGLGVRNKQGVFDNYLNESRPLGVAHKAMVCMLRYCYDTCTFMFGGDPNVL